MQTDVLNPTPYWDAQLDDSIGPDFGLETMRRSQLATAKPAGGQPYTRVVGNGGHSCKLSWMNRSVACVEKLKRFAEQFEQGFFTLIDYDRGRQYVGNFVGDMPITQAGNDRYNVQGWQFEEIPGVPMLVYPGSTPADWDRWGVFENPFDDYGIQRSVTTGSGVAPLHHYDGTSPVLINPGGSGPGMYYDSMPVPSPPRPAGDATLGYPTTCLANYTAAAGDSLTHEYRGYGFQLWLGNGPQYGQWFVTLDGTPVDVVDCYAPQDRGPQMMFSLPQVPLGLHRVKVFPGPAPNPAATGAGLLWQRIQVMR